MIFIMKGPVFSLFAISCKSIMRHLYLLAIARSRIKNNEITLWHVGSWIRMPASVRVSMSPFHSLSGAGSNLFNFFTLLDHITRVCILWIYVNSPIQIRLYKHIILRAHTPVFGISTYASLRADVNWYRSIWMSNDRQEDLVPRPYHKPWKNSSFHSLPVYAVLSAFVFSGILSEETKLWRRIW